MGSETLELIARAQSGDKAASEALLRDNQGLIWSVVRRFFGRGAEGDDLYQLGCIGFLKAIEGFNPAFGTQFSTYAVPKISGEIRRFIRDDGAIKVSRTVKERAAQIMTTRHNLEQSLGREPTVSEIAAYTGMTVEDIAATETAVSPAESLQQETAESGLSLEGMLGETGQEERIIEKVCLDVAIAVLPQQEQKVIALRFFHALTQQNCARILGISQVQVSRLEKRALNTLRSALSGTEG